jgi:hypothetical protein
MKTDFVRYSLLFIPFSILITLNLHYLICHSRADGNPLLKKFLNAGKEAFAGMTL